MTEITGNIRNQSDNTESHNEIEENDALATTIDDNPSSNKQQPSYFEDVLYESGIECLPIISEYDSTEPMDLTSHQDILLENEKLNKSNEQYGNLLRQRDDVIDLQKKELALLEAEKEAIQREYVTGRKEKEHAVVRFATLEKSIIDANTAKDLLARKLKDSQKETENLTKRLKQVSGERDKAHKEIREFLRESEQMKYHVQTMETKLKWSQRNLTIEKATKTELEKKCNDLTEQLNQLNEQRQQQIDTERKCEQEQDAQLIMLKHSVDAKERSLIQLQKSHDDLKTEFTCIFEEKEELSKALELEQQKFTDLENKFGELEKANRELTISFEELQNRFELSENHVKESMEENDRITVAINKLKYIEESYIEQSEEMAELRNKEDEFLSLLKDITEKCVFSENKLILANSKSSALQLDNERLNKEFKGKANAMNVIEEELVKMRHKHSEEIKLFNRILADEKNHSSTLQSRLDDIAGDLEATRNKHSQTVKELNRELIMLQKSSNQSSPSADSGFGTDIENRRDATMNQSSEMLSNGAEPTKKALIDRIVKLQRQLAKQTEKIEFLENHCVALFNELKSKSL